MIIEPGRITIDEIVEAVKGQLSGILAFKQVQGGQNLTEGIPETPLVQVYFDTINISGTNTDRMTMGSPNQRAKRNYAIEISVDLLARQRSNLGDDMVAVHRNLEPIVSLLEAQNAKPYFGLPAIGSFSWSAERVDFQYADVKYSGVRFTLTFYVV